jgi:tetratricopeptide (TPR) repeat protein
MKKPVKIILAAVILMATAGFLITRGYFSRPAGHAKNSWDDKARLDYANLLLAKGLNSEAAGAFESCVNNNRMDAKDLAGVCYKLGNIYVGLGQYEKALSNFYKSELLDPASSYRQEMSQKIVTSLESLGLSQQAQYELDSRTSVKPDERRPEKIGVRIGKREISNEEIDMVINRLPEHIKKSLNSNDAKLKFVREYVATEVLYDKGKKLGLDRDNNIRYAVEDFKKQLVLQELLRDEINKQLKISPEDVYLYYKANMNKYQVPERVKVSFLEMDDQSGSNSASAALKQGKGRKIEQWISKGSAFLPSGIGESKEAVDDIFARAKGELSGPFKIGDKFYMFVIEQKEPQRQQEFEEVKDRAAEEYRRQKEQQIVQSFLDKAVEQQEIEIFYQPKTENEKSPR